MNSDDVVNQIDGAPDGSWFFHCPGCGFLHQVNAGWTFNGDRKKPTFRPSILVTSDYGPERVKRVCHSFVTDGSIQFLSDCTHALAGQTVQLEPP